MGGRVSYLKLVNETHTNIIDTIVYDVNGCDFVKGHRPDRNFQHQKISSKGGSVVQPEGLKKGRNHCGFTMNVHFADGTMDIFRIHQKNALGCCHPFHHRQKCHDIIHDRINGNTLCITFKNTEQQLNTIAEKLKQEGEMKMKEKHYDEALKMFDKALKLTKNDSLVDGIKEKKSKVFAEKGKDFLKEAWELEGDDSQDRSKEAESKFRQAKTLFEGAQNIKDDSENQQHFDIVSLKILGNELFNEASKLEGDAFKLFESARNTNVYNDYSLAQDKYKEALTKYKEALKKFEEGVKFDGNKFGDCVVIANQHIGEVEKVIDDIDRAELNYNITKVSVDTEIEKEKEAEETITIVLQEQVDVATG